MQLTPVNDERKATHVMIPIRVWQSAVVLLQDLPFRSVGGTMNNLMAQTRLLLETADQPESPVARAVSKAVTALPRLPEPAEIAKAVENGKPAAK